MQIPITICLFTTTKGHWGTKDRYKETINWLDNKIPLRYFSGLVANIKVSPEDEGTPHHVEMLRFLTSKGFSIHQDIYSWAHGAESHQKGYINDMRKVYNNPKVLKTPYVLHLEDDWKINSLDGELIDWIRIALSVLDEDPEILQVRFARFSDEYDRILGLKAKHNIDGKVKILTDNIFASNDLSLNPSIFRGRDLKNALILYLRNLPNLPLHVEMGFSIALKYFSESATPFAVLNPEKVKAAHIGSPLGGEDDPLILKKAD